MFSRTLPLGVPRFIHAPWSQKKPTPEKKFGDSSASQVPKNKALGVTQEISTRGSSDPTLKAFVGQRGDREEEIQFSCHLEGRDRQREP